MTGRPQLVIVAGPNGAGKSTAAPQLLRDTLGIGEFVNADSIAAGLSAFQSETVAVAAGRLLLRRSAELTARRVSFAFETTFAGRTMRTLIPAMQRRGYRVHLLFLALDSPQLAITRVAERVRLGGHDVPAETVRRRYTAGLRNFFRFGRELADSWMLLDNSNREPVLIATGTRGGPLELQDPVCWVSLERQIG